MRLFIGMLHAFIFFWTSWSPGVVATPTPVDLGPCTNHPCGPPEGAVCIPAGRDFKCECKPGYVQTPHKTCVPMGPCGRYPCGPNSERCLWVAENQYRCICKKGFAEQRLIQPTCVEADGECGDHPCGLGGLCKPTPDGAHVCECLTGYEQAPSTKGATCRRTQKVGCEQMPCGDEAIAKCVETPTGYFCVCREGSRPAYNEEGNPFCLPEQGYNPCYLGACGEQGASCTFDGDRRTCTCEEQNKPMTVNLWDDERCYPSTEEEGNKEPGGTEPGDKKSSEKVSSTVLIAGGVVAAVVLVGAIAGAVVYRRRKSASSQQPPEHQGSIDFEGREGDTAHDSEADVLIKAKNEDWAH